MNQLAIDFTAPHARRSDPETSHKAAERAPQFATSHAGRILLALQLHGERSAHELSQLIGLTVVQIDRRLPDLAKLGLAAVAKLDDGADKVTHGCRVWKAV